MNRREFCIGIGPALGVVASARAQSKQATTASLGSEAGPSGPAPVDPTRPRPLLGWHRYASRYIAPPVWRFEAVRNAVEYRAELRSSAYRADFRDAADKVQAVTSRTPELSLEPVWKDLLPGAARAEIVAIDKSGATLARETLLFHKARPFSGAIPPWKHSVPEMVNGVAAFLLDLRSPNAVEPDRSPLLWHAIIYTNGTVSPLGYPTHNAYHMEQYRCYKPVECCNAWLFEALLAAHRATGRDVYLQKSRALAAALSHFRRPNGSFATWCFYASPDRQVEAGDWFSCMVYDGHMLMRHEKALV
jgi:hypothetical protein